MNSHGYGQYIKNKLIERLICTKAADWDQYHPRISLQGPGVGLVYDLQDAILKDSLAMCSEG